MEAHLNLTIQRRIKHYPTLGFRFFKIIPHIVPFINHFSIHYVKARGHQPQPNTKGQHPQHKNSRTKNFTQQLKALGARPLSFFNPSPSMKLNLNINEKHPTADFERIADDLMNHWILRAGDGQYRLAEIEFYFQSKEHSDVYLHGHPLQAEQERWYFHGSGLDLTIGTGNTQGGILIRALYDIQKEHYIYGPLNSVGELLSNLPPLYHHRFDFGLSPAATQQLAHEKPIAAPRVGLNPDKDPEKYHALYRFLIMPKRKHANKTQIVESMIKQGYSEEEANAIWA